MKPKNRIYCPDCGRPKMLFETERKANDFIKWNAKDIQSNGDKLRSYYCSACCGWHISHHEHSEGYDSRTDNLIGAYRRQMKKRVAKSLDRLIINPNMEAELQKKGEEIFNGVPEDIKNYDTIYRLRAYLSDYFKENSIDDQDGRIRGVVYKLWREYKQKKQ